ncbi:2352_t:CDS:2 [Paraglomus occultum]|uniref:2352_t:CDS:1 n=1 Tax=Paraglomus occultum TaxID=144539 RepID=A0A9N8WI20_9GLOM|nr:2352_t:CDS:2 [Paraglomus occultum]
MPLPSNISQLPSKEVYNKVKGLIFGAALGDAIGLSTEFFSKSQARELYGLGPIKFGTEDGYPFYLDNHRARWQSGDWTDDTDQQILLVQSLLSQKGRLLTKDFANRLKIWAKDGFPELDDKPPFGIGLTVGSVLSHPKFLFAPHQAAWEVWNQFGKNMAANGALMRTAVLGVPYFWDEKQVIKQTLQATKVTHADPRCCVASVICTVIVSRILRGETQGSGEEIKDEDVINWMRSGIPGNRPEENIDNEESVSEVPTAEQNEAVPRRSIARRLSDFGNSLLGRSSNERTPRWVTRLSTRPQFTPRQKPTIPNNPPPGMDTFGADDEMLTLTQNVVNKYKFMVVAPMDNETEETDPGRIRPNLKTNSGEGELLQHCFPPNIAALDLDEHNAIGYVYKCLGSALYCFTRDLSKCDSEGEAFKRIITELVLEAGDSDTNGEYYLDEMIANYTDKYN